MEGNNKYKILTIDDEAYIRQNIVNYLEDFGFTVFQASNGKKGLEVFERENPDLVVTDQTMPERTGVELAKEIITIDSSIPVIL